MIGTFFTFIWKTFCIFSSSKSLQDIWKIMWYHTQKPYYNLYSANLDLHILKGNTKTCVYLQWHYNRLYLIIQALIFTKSFSSILLHVCIHQQSVFKQHLCYRGLVYYTPFIVPMTLVAVHFIYLFYIFVCLLLSLYGENNSSYIWNIDFNVVVMLVIERKIVRKAWFCFFVIVKAGNLLVISMRLLLYAWI